MKSPAGKPRPARQPAAKKPVQLNLQRTPTWPEEDELNERPDGNFWKWFGLVFLFHVVAFIVLILLFNHRAKPPEPEFISLLPPGETVKGAPGASAAHKIANATPAPSQPATPTPPAPSTPPKAKVQKVQPPAPKPTPLVTDNAPTPIAPPVKPKPKPPVKPKVKVDLTLADAPQDDTPAPAPPKPKAAKPKKPAHKTPASTASTAADTQGLSKEQVAQKLGDQFQDQGAPEGAVSGTNGDLHGHKNDFSGFYQSIHDQVMSKWAVPNAVDETATDPVVQIHVEKDGRVPADRVKLVHPSGNPAFDQAAVDAARSIGYTLQPLPEGCPPDMSIIFNLRQQ